jgi:hypothetical protein
LTAIRKPGYASVRDAGLHFAEVGRSAVLQAYRNPRVIMDLWKSAVLFANRRGKDHFVGVVHVNFTDSLIDAGIVHAKLARHGSRALPLLFALYSLRFREPSTASRK